MKDLIKSEETIIVLFRRLPDRIDFWLLAKAVGKSHIRLIELSGEYRKKKIDNTLKLNALTREKRGSMLKLLDADAKITHQWGPLKPLKGGLR